MTRPDLDYESKVPPPPASPAPQLEPPLNPPAVIGVMLGVFGFLFLMMAALIVFEAAGPLAFVPLAGVALVNSFALWLVSIAKRDALRMTALVVNLVSLALAIVMGVVAVIVR